MPGRRLIRADFLSFSRRAILPSVLYLGYARGMNLCKTSIVQTDAETPNNWSGSSLTPEVPNLPHQIRSHYIFLRGQ
jgi:hypothetical protein